MESQTKPDVIAAVAAGLIALVCYLITLLPGLAGGDAGELAVAAYRFSVAHPPGYPLYVLLGKLATWVPWGSVIVRLNAFSAFCMAGGVGLITFVATRVSAKRWAGLAAGALFAFAPLTWTWAIQAEVFALNILMASALIAVACLCAEAPTLHKQLTFAFLLGLGLSNHHTLILLGLPLVFVVMRKASLRIWIQALCVGALGLSPYLQLLWGLSHAPVLAWGDVSTLAGFVRHLLRADYGTLSLGTAQASAWPGLGAFLADQPRQLVVIGVLVVGIGVVQTRKQPHAALLQALLVAWTLSAIGFHLLARFRVDTPLLHDVLARFWLLPLLLAAVFFACGLAHIAQGSARRMHVALALAVVLPLAQWGHGFVTRPRASGLVETYAHAVLESLPPNAVVLTRGDLLHNTLRYAQEAEGIRDDVVLLDQELLTYAWYVSRQRDAGRVTLPANRYNPSQGFSMAAFMAANATHAVFFVGGLKPGDSSLTDFTEIGAGLATRVVANSHSAAQQTAITHLPNILRALDNSAFGKAVHEATDNPWSAALVQEYWEAKHRLPLAMLRWLTRFGAQAPITTECIGAFERLIEQHPNPPFQYYKNLGIAFGLAGDAVGQHKAFRAYLQRAPKDETDYATVERALAR